MEPFKLNTNYIDIWAYDLADGINKRFKTDRIGEVEILRDDWEQGRGPGRLPHPRE
ncbi:MAG: hypothetical protein IJQ61_07795 [Bacteroidales bacterium]|nr:hypothetical protein [Bacteroidales bacterium]